jgi:hypothetical protein
LIEGAEEYLRRLSDAGYIRLFPGEAGTGFVEITDEGLKKIRQHRAFEANSPRSFDRWEISLLGERGIRHMRLWRADWEGRQITVRNRWHLFGERWMREGGTVINEYLNVGNRFPPGYRVEKSGFYKDLYGELRATDGVYEIHAHIGLTAPLRRVGCLISVDGVVVGGDVGKRFLT